MHRLFHTEAFVLSLRPRGEGSAMVILYTRELGLVPAWAQSMLTLQSKLRYHLQPFSHVRVSLVRGRDKWRVTGVVAAEESIRVSKITPRLQLVARVLGMLSRLLQGEETDTDLFDQLRVGLAALADATAESTATIEIVLVLGLLHRLGYIPDDPVVSPLLVHSTYTEIPTLSVSTRARAVQLINQALRESHL